MESRQNRSKNLDPQSGPPVSRDPLAGTLFILGDFPQSSQTFIQREMVEMKRRGLSVNVFADTEIKRDDLPPLLGEIQQATQYQPHAARWIPRGILRGMLRPAHFASALGWAVSLPHRTPYHRARFLSALVAAADLVPYVRERGFRYFHAHFAAYQTEIAMCLSRLTGLPYGATWHAYGIWKDRNIIEEKVKGAQVILSCTENNVRHLKSLVPEAKDRIHLVYHGLDLGRLPDSCPVPDHDTPEWLAIGRLTPKKGFGFLINAARLLVDRGIPFRLNIAGDGPLMGELAAQVNDLGLGEVVTLLGAIPIDEVFARLRDSHGLVAPSVRDPEGDVDGIPNVLLEAMAMKRPVIGTDLSGIPEVVRTGETGILVAPEDPSGLAEALAQLSGDLDFARRAGQKGRELIENQFDVRRSVEQQIQLLEKAQTECHRRECDSR